MAEHPAGAEAAGTAEATEARAATRASVVCMLIANGQCRKSQLKANGNRQEELKDKGLNIKSRDKKEFKKKEEAGRHFM